MINLQTKIKNIDPIGKKISSKLKKLNISNCEDLLSHYPFRYDDFSIFKKISEIKNNETVNIIGTIELIQNKRSKIKKINITEALISDLSGTIKAIWFNQPFIAKILKNGDKISIAGKIENDFSGFILKSPEYEKIDKKNKTLHTQGLIPIYHSTENITQKQIRHLIKKILPLTENIKDFLPEKIIKNNNLLDLKSAIKKIHFPKEDQDIKQARKRIAFDEIFLIQLKNQYIKQKIKKYIATPIKFNEKETKELLKTLPFELTDDQKKATWQIIKDIDKKNSMSRLLNGDVGSGKTIVTVIVMLNVFLNKKKSILMAPTEILAKQHYKSFKKVLRPFKIPIALITKNEKILSTDKEKTPLEKITEKAYIIIGTHALIQDKINIKNLSLVVIDEQHRFGVEQRKKLINSEKNKTPHFLSMTATPIPRTLAITMFGDLDLSTIKEMPKERKKILTYTIEEEKRNKMYEFLKKEIKDGRQVFIICPLINESDKLEVKSVEQEFIKIKTKVFPDLKIEKLHGKLETEEKNEIMEKFSKNKIDILVSTSVLEVGIDIPNANIIVIEGADRFGISQLHQFRGRVGRDKHQSYCFLLSKSNSPKTKDRLNALTKYHDGFNLAQIDLKFRGPGEIYGTDQKGFPEFKIASFEDINLIENIEKIIKNLIKSDKELKNYPQLLEKIDNLNKTIHLE